MLCTAYSIHKYNNILGNILKYNLRYLEFMCGIKIATI